MLTATGSLVPTLLAVIVHSVVSPHHKIVSSQLFVSGKPLSAVSSFTTVIGKFASWSPLVKRRLAWRTSPLGTLGASTVKRPGCAGM